MSRKPQSQPQQHLLLLHSPGTEPSLANREFAILELVCGLESVPCRTSYANLNSNPTNPDPGEEIRQIIDREDWEVVSNLIVPISPNQAQASLAVANVIRRRYPAIGIYGFTDIQSRPFAEAILTVSSAIDAVILEDLARAGRQVVRRLHDSPTNLKGIPGVLLRLPNGGFELNLAQTEPASVESFLPDYGPFLQHLQESKHRHTLPSLPVPICRPNAADVTAEILALSRRHKVVRFDLGDVTFAPHDPSATLEELARLRREHLYGISFQCRIRDWLSQEQINLLAQAGVTSASMDLRAFPPSVLSDLTASEINFRQVQMVRRFFAAGIEIHWYLMLPKAGSSTAGEENNIANNLAALYHLPPPKGLLSFLDQRVSMIEEEVNGQGGVTPDSTVTTQPAEADVESLADAVRRWQQANSTGLLTYARGPGFVRIFDRRAGSGQWAFINLKVQQAQVFLRCEEGLSFDEIAAIDPATPTDKLRKFLNHLIDRRIIYHNGDKCYQSLPIRRKMEERWASADYA